MCTTYIVAEQDQGNLFPVHDLEDIRKVERVRGRERRNSRIVTLLAPKDLAQVSRSVLFDHPQSTLCVTQEYVNFLYTVVRFSFCLEQ